MSIEGRLDGFTVCDGTQAGFMEFGDALALRHWLLRYLRGERNFLSGGDAG